MKSIITSISPYLCEKIASGDCKILVKKSAPKEVPFKAYIYSTRPKKYYKCGAVSTSDELLWLSNGKVEMGDGFKFWADGDKYQCLNGRIIGEFICDKVELFKYDYDCGVDIEYDTLLKTSIDRQDINVYSQFKNLYGWHISDLKIYDKSKELEEFIKLCNCKGHCFMCEREIVKQDKSKQMCVCYEKVTRPPQSWMYGEEIETR